MKIRNAICRASCLIIAIGSLVSVHVSAQKRGSVRRVDQDKREVAQPVDRTLLGHEETTGVEPNCRMVGGRKVYTYVESMPEFRGDFNTYLRKSLRYPESARHQRAEGRVLVRFVIEANGIVTSPEVIRNAHPALDSEALRVVRAMPPWQPARHGGKAVPVLYVVPVTFRLPS